jgi:RHS repeat-associated protein
VAASTANEHPNQPHQATESPSSAQQSANKVLDNLLKDYIGTHYEYDARGNMVKRIHNGQTTTFVWDNFNRMVQSNSQDVRTTYVYDALGRRIMKHSEPMFSATGDAGSGYEAIQKSKIRRDKNLGLIVYGWDGDVLAWESNFGSHTDINHQTGQIEAAFDNSRTTHYIYEPNSFVPMIQASRQGRIQLLPTPDYGRFRRGEAQYDIDQDPVWHYQAKAQPFDAVAFYQCDHLGTPQELTDMNGEIAWAAEYKAWGYAYDALSKAGRAAGLKQPLRFQGQYYDHETGLHYNRHRYYDPHSGRFVSKDPIGLRGGINVHAYGPNPIEWTDPMGLKGIPIPLHGNWCGPNYTGQFHKSWDDMTPQEQQTADGRGFTDVLDSHCQIHDKCHAQCRALYPCNTDKQSECLVACDRDLYRGGQTDPVKSWKKQRIINYMSDSHPEGEMQGFCPKPPESENPMDMWGGGP